MAIGSAIERGRMVYVYDEKGRQLCSKALGSDGCLMGYTGTSFSIRKGKMVYVYDEKGHQLSSKIA
ncbi:hypothetical protein [Succinivibrio dextrinosolvens]|uniref:hypothetical protein n=1 Tax=Succinivibrio dextrinosolvens TaxID=83771 RepID=UPI00247838B7|nr:hypothetical protein [Succinivibrio dextrinosolvens]